MLEYIGVAKVPKGDILEYIGVAKVQKGNILK
jgi:hypothetical protein